MTTQTLGPHQQALVDALESGEYTQTTAFLRTENGYCCLGVACDIARTQLDPPTNWGDSQPLSGYFIMGHNSILPDKIKTYFAFHTNGGTIDTQKLPDTSRLKKHNTLTEANDLGVPFTKIAAAMRQYPNAFFKKPA